MLQVPRTYLSILRLHTKTTTKAKAKGKCGENVFFPKFEDVFPKKQKTCDKIFHFPIAFVQNSHKRMTDWNQDFWKNEH